MTEEQKKAAEAYLAQLMSDRGITSPEGNQQPQTPAAPQKFTFAGQEWETKEAAEAAYAAWYKEQEQKLQSIQRQQQQSAVAPPVTQQPATPPRFDQQQYFKVLTEDPIEAQKMALRQILFGNAEARDAAGNLIDPAPILQQGIMSSFQTTNEVMELKMRASHPEVPWHDPKAMEAIEQMRVSSNLPNNAQGRELAVERLQARGLMPTPRDMEQRRQQWQQQQQPRQNVAQMPRDNTPVWATNRPDPPPVIPAGGAQGEMSQEDFETWFSGLSLLQQRALRDEMRQQQQRQAAGG